MKTFFTITALILSLGLAIYAAMSRIDRGEDGKSRREWPAALAVAAAIVIAGILVFEGTKNDKPEAESAPEAVAAYDTLGTVRFQGNAYLVVKYISDTTGVLILHKK